MLGQSKIFMNQIQFYQTDIYLANFTNKRKIIFLYFVFEGSKLWEAIDPYCTPHTFIETLLKKVFFFFQTSEFRFFTLHIAERITASASHGTKTG